jgi:hypothetical protein
VFTSKRPQHVSAPWRAQGRLHDFSNQVVGHRLRLQPPHRPGGSNDLEQAVRARGRVRHGVLGHLSSPLKIAVLPIDHHRAATRSMHGGGEVTILAVGGRGVAVAADRPRDRALARTPVKAGEQGEFSIPL